MLGVGDRVFHQVGFDGVLGAGGDVEFYFGGFAGPLVHAEDEGVGVFSFLDRAESYVGRVERDKGVCRGQLAGVGEDLLGEEWGVELVAAADRERVFPGAGVRVELVDEVLGAAVGVGVGPGGRAEEGEAEDVACRVVAVLAVVEEREALVLIA